VIVGTVYLTGYQSWIAAELDAEVERLKATLVDIRFKAWSGKEEWRTYTLKARLGKRYAQVPQLGNVNYKSEGPIKLSDEVAGMILVEGLLKKGPVVLLCACWDAETCHRKAAGAALAGRGHDVKELPKIKREVKQPPPPSGGGPVQGTLF
jgi:hypothetical protein